jgi:hypothetical protein
MARRVINIACMEGERSVKFIDELRVYKLCNSHVHNPGLVCVSCCFLEKDVLGIQI